MNNGTLILDDQQVPGLKHEVDPKALLADLQFHKLWAHMLGVAAARRALVPLFRGRPPVLQGRRAWARSMGYMNFAALVRDQQKQQAVAA